jgi:hypothetical protein
MKEMLCMYDRPPLGLLLQAAAGWNFLRLTMRSQGNCGHFCPGVTD